MAYTLGMVRSGLFITQAKAISEPLGVATALSGAGTTQADGTAITNEANIFTTVALNTGAVLPANAEVGDEWLLANAGANPLLTYPPVGGYINGLAQNASYSLAAGKAAHVQYVAAGRFILIAA
jgi:hypothetical protein